MNSTIRVTSNAAGFLDVGLMQNVLGVQVLIILDDSVMQINAGSIAEQFVAQELIANADPYADKKLHLLSYFDNPNEI